MAISSFKHEHPLGSRVLMFDDTKIHLSLLILWSESALFTGRRIAISNIHVLELMDRVLLLLNVTEKRQAEAARIREKYPDRIPVIVERAEKSDVPDIDKKKYLVPADLTVGQFVYVVRKRIKLSPEKAIFIFVKNILPPTAAIMSAIYEEHKDEDGFLYMSYSGENTFGIIF
ncbi:unnamed protein product [Arabidopsis halleri]